MYRKTQRIGTTEDHTSYTRVKNMVKRHLDQVTKNQTSTLETTGQRMQLPSDGNQRTEAKMKTNKSQDCRQWMAKGRCSKGELCSFKHDISKKRKGKGKRDRPSSPLQRPRSQSKDCHYGKSAANGKSPERQPNQLSCFSHLKGKCTTPSCDYGQPPARVKLKTDKSFTLGETCAILRVNNEPQNKKSKKRPDSEKATNAIVRSYQELGC